MVVVCRRCRWWSVIRHQVSRDLLPRGRNAVPYDSRAGRVCGIDAWFSLLRNARCQSGGGGAGDNRGDLPRSIALGASGVCPLHCADCGRLGVVLLGRSALGFARRARARSTAGRNDDSIRARDPPAACRARHPIWTVRIGFRPVARRLRHTAATSGRGQPCPSVFGDASARGSLSGRAGGACWTGCVARFPMVRADSRAVRHSAARVGGSDTQLSDSVESDAPPQHRGGARSDNRALACDTSDVAALGQDAGRPVARHGDRVRDAD